MMMMFLWSMILYIFLFFSSSWNQRLILMMSNLMLFFFFLNMKIFMIFQKISLMMLILIWLIFFIILMNESFLTNQLFFKTLYNKLLFSMYSILMYLFMTKKILIFFIMFEFSLIPMLLLILGIGYQPERVMASMAMMMYMLLSSMPLLLILMKMLNLFSQYFIFQLLNNQNTQISQFIWLNSMFFFLSLTTFFIKFPMFTLHLWLPKAHVEAPLSGSMILASILLKLAGYGMIIFNNWLMVKKLSNFFSFFSLLGGSWASLICLRQLDLKVLIAYFSVSHMSICISSILSNQKLAVSGMFMILFSHGIVSSGLFYMAFLIYLFAGSRNMMLSKNMLNWFPFFKKTSFFLIMGNMSSPPTFNFLGEILLFSNLMNKNFYYSFPSIFLIVMSVIVNILLFVNLSNGDLKYSNKKNFSLILSSYTSNINFIFPLFMMFFMTNLYI